MDASSGRLLWRYDEPAAGSAANIPSPIAAGSDVFAATNQAGGGLVRVTGAGTQLTAAPLYFAKRLGVGPGGAVKVGDTVYGSTQQGLQAMDWASGEIRWQQRGIGAASIAAVGDRLYLHGENGDVALVDASPAGYQERGRFTPAEKPELGQAKAWAHPVVANGRLYLRQANVLWSYDVASPAGR